MPILPVGENFKNLTEKNNFPLYISFIGLLAKTIGGTINFIDVIGY